MRRFVVIGGLVASLIAPPATAVFADNPHTAGTTGRPNQSCEQQPSRPGRASTAHGSAFNPTGVAGSHYAGEQPQNSRNNQASQYDVACFQVPR